MLLGLCSYYRHFIKDFAAKATPLTSVMGKVARWEWGERQEEAVQLLKEALVSEPILRTPDLQRPFQVHTDASREGVGAVLAQRDADGRSYVVRYMSRKLSSAQQRYSTTEREYLAVVAAIKAWRRYLAGNHFEV